MKRQVLEFQANRTEAMLAQHQISARVTGGLLFPRWIRFNLRPAIGTRVDKAQEISQALAMVLGVGVCCLLRQNGLLAFDIPRPDHQPVRLLPVLWRLVERDEIPSYTAAVGLSENSVPLLAGQSPGV